MSLVIPSIGPHNPLSALTVFYCRESTSEGMIDCVCAQNVCIHTTTCLMPNLLFVGDELNQQLTEWMDQAPTAPGTTRAVIAPYVLSLNCVYCHCTVSCMSLYCIMYVIAPYVLSLYCIVYVIAMCVVIKCVYCHCTVRAPVCIVLFFYFELITL